MSINAVRASEWERAAVEQMHSGLAALLHTALANDPQASPEGFKRARDLGLITDGNPRTTPLGQGVLRALGIERAGA